jgi:flagellar biosynthesis GTPase FlhF
MKIVRHIAPDMRQAMRSIREQLGEDAVILSSRRIPEGVEITAAVDFDASSLTGHQAQALTAAPLPTQPVAASHALASARAPAAPSNTHVASQQVALTHAPGSSAARAFAHAAATKAAATERPAGASQHEAAKPVMHAVPGVPYGAESWSTAGSPTQAPAPAYSHAATSHYFPAASAGDAHPFAHILGPEPTPVTSSSAARAYPTAPAALPAHVPSQPANALIVPAGDSLAGRSVAPAAYTTSTEANTPTATSVRQAPRAPTSEATARREPTLNITVSDTDDLAAEALADFHTTPAAVPAGDSLAGRSVAPAGDSLAGRSVAAQSGDAMGTELKTLRRMLETQLAQLAWNDLTRRAPVHVEILRELTEIGISQELSEYILKQLPDKVELGFARRFAIAGLSQYLLVTGDRWLENGGRVAFIGATGVGKTTTLAKLAVRWVLRHGPRDIALVGSDTVRIGAQDQIQSLGQLLGVPVYTPENFESLPTLLSRLGDRHRMILIDTPGSSLRDGQLASRLGVLSNCASQMETALVLAASTQAGAVEETVKRYVPANPACCVLTKVDEAASLGGALSVLIKARLPVSYLSEGQRVPEDLRPARALELVSTAVRLAKASGATADEDLLRRRFGKTANAIT